MRRSLRAATLALVAASVSLALPAPADEEPSVEALVRMRYHEGLPLERALALSGRQLERLAQLLRDPGWREHHANVLLALGMSGRPEAAAPLIAYAAEVPAGRVGADVYRAQLALRTALGHLAASDARARRWLIADVRREDPLPWSHLHLDGARLREVLRNAAVNALGISGHPVSLAELRRLRERAESDPAARKAWRRHLQSAEALGRRVERDGRRRVFSGLGEGAP